MAKCNHDFWDAESSVFTEGLCPLCLVRDNQQMRACLEDIQKNAATMKLNAGSWAAGMALLCLNTLRAK